MGRLKFAVIDVETTGLHPRPNHRVVELAVVHLDETGHITGTWETLLNPKRDLGAQSIHGIRASDVLDAPTFDQIAGHLVRLLDGRVLVAHNAGFDYRFLGAEFSRTGLEVPFSDSDALCTMHLASTFLPGAGRGLKDCCAAFDIELTNAHSAGADAMATAQLLASYLRMAPNHYVWQEVKQRANRFRWPQLPVVQAAGVTRRTHGTWEPHFLERISERLPQTSGLKEHTEYFALLDRCLLDRRLSEHERNALVDLANELAISRSDCERIHQIYFDELVVVAWDDGILTQDEKDDLQTVATLLAINPEHLRFAFAGPPRRNVVKSGKSAPLLSPGDRVVLTGEMELPRVEWERKLEALGFQPWGAVTKQVRLVVAADPDSLSGKARKARDYGIPIVDERGLERLLSSHT